MSKPFYDEEMSRRQERVAATGDMRAQRHYVLGLMQLQPGEAVLDVGTGNGIFSREMLAIVGETGQVTGVDGSETMVMMAREICPNGTFLQGDATDLPVESGRFDVVTASQVLCFVPDAARAVAEMFRILKPGGRLIVLDSDWGSLVWNCSDPVLGTRVRDVMTSAYADAQVPRTLSHHLTAAGFEITGRHAYPILNWAPGEDAYSQQLLDHLEPMAEGVEDFDAVDVEAWMVDQKSMLENGTYMFCLNRFVFCACKP